MTDPLVRPFQIAVADALLLDLRARLHNTRWPEAELVDDWSQGAPLKWIQDICAYWADSFDWRRQEAALNRFSQFITELDGIDVHFIHVRSPHADAMPLLLTHGWPGSVAEFHKVIEPLTNPTAFGGKAADAFHVVCPSLPGFGFSGKPTTTGWGIDRIAQAWMQLMTRLGYARYAAQGGDWGSAVTSSVGAQDPVLGLPAMRDLRSGMVEVVPLTLQRILTWRSSVKQFQRGRTNIPERVQSPVPDRFLLLPASRHLLQVAQHSGLERCESTTESSHDAVEGCS